jgi:hypothetical protein
MKPCGDYNLVLNLLLDYNNYKTFNHNRNARKLLLQEISNRNLIDPFRELHGDVRKFTWKRLTPLQQGRLDLFLITNNMMQYVRECEIDISYKSDHSPILLKLCISPREHGKGLWKFNNSLLNDIDYINCINNKIDEIIKQYCLPIYNLNNVLTVNKEDIQFSVNDQLFLETLLMEIRGKTISYSSYKQKIKNSHERTLLSEILEIESNLNETNKEQLLALQNELINLRNEKLNGSFIRSRANWIEQGEKSTKYFCNLEKQHASNKSIPFIQLDSGSCIYNQSDILQETAAFYENLYNEQQTNTMYDLNNDLKDCSAQKLNHKEACSLEGLLTFDEVTYTLKHMKNDKSPGSDGFTTNFYKIFWNKIGKFVVRALNHAFLSDAFSRNIKLGTIICIPKDNKPNHLLKNWRPITLLNVLYKLASGSIANRLKSVLDKLISRDQTGFVKGRYIGENTRLLYDIMKHCEENNLPGLVMLIDFEKAFDSLSFNFIENTLNFFNFGDMFKKWVKLFLHNTEVCVQLNGYLSQYFQVKRGCRQGDPISSYIFILCAEILALKIKNSKNIKGITIKENEYIISQFADDTSLLLDGSEKSLHNVLDVLNYFSLISGLKVNFDKTKLIRIGSLKYSTRSIKTKWKLSWGDTQFKLLGINFDVDLNKMCDLNYADKMTQVKRCISHWKRRKLTILGRITVVKTLLIPLFTHLFVSLPSPSDSFIKSLTETLNDYVWEGKAKIKNSVFIKSYENGGLRMIDVPSYICSLKVKWIRNFIIHSESQCYKLVDTLFDMHKLLNCGKLYCEKVAKKIKNSFWIDVLKSYIRYIEKFEISSIGQILNMPLFYNENFLVNKNPIFIEKMYDRGKRFIKDVIDQNGNYIEFSILEKITGKINFLHLLGLKRVVTQFLAKKNIVFDDKVHTHFHNPSINCYLYPILTGDNVNKIVYNVMIENKEVPTSKEK